MIERQQRRLSAILAAEVFLSRAASQRIGGRRSSHDHDARADQRGQQIHEE
jgi:hypothetical protein